MKKLEWTTQKMKVSDLIELEFNPRKISEEKRQKLIDSLDRFNLVEIPAVTTDRKIIGGNQRVKALLIAGRGDEMIDVRVPNRKLTNKEIKEYNLISNSHAGEFDFEVLDVEFADIEIDDLGFDLDGWDDYQEQKARTEAAEEDNFETPEGGRDTDIVLGDLFEIGPHRLLCGDSTKTDDVKILMNGEKADMVFTDPPYGVAIGAKNRFLNSFQKAGRNLKDIIDDEKSPDELFVILTKAFTNLKNVLNDCCTVYVTAPQGGGLGMMKMMMMMQKSGLEVRHVLIWKKNRATFSMGRLDYDYQHEPILMTWNKSHKFYGKGKFKTSIWEVDNPLKNKEHPTMKPIALIENALLNNSKNGDLVADIFLGSGSTMVAAHQLGRKCYGMELDPRYCQVIIDRMRKLDPSLKILKNGKSL